MPCLWLCDHLSAKRIQLVQLLERGLAQKYKKVNTFLLGQTAEPAHQVQASIRAVAQEGRDLFCQQ